MKRKLLAAILTIAMAISLFSGVIFAADKTEPSIKVHEWWGTAGTWSYNQVEGQDGSDTMVLEAVASDWGTINCKQIVSGLDAATTYTLSAMIKGDWANMNWGVKQLATGEVLGGSWKEITFEFTGATAISLSAQVQSQSGFLGGKAYLDDVVVKDGEEVVFSEDFESAPAPVAPTKAPMEPSDPNKIRIMCIGDSITQGSGNHGNTVEEVDGQKRPDYIPAQTGEYSYRYPLWKMLVDSGVDFEFVGSATTGFITTPVYEDYKGLTFPNIHEGYWGDTIQGVTPKVVKSISVEGNYPDVAIINLGTNGNETVDVKKGYMSDMIDAMRAEKADIKFILAGPFNTWFGDLRSAYADLAKTKSTEESPIIVTTQPAMIDHPFTQGSWTNDWVHTSKAGDEGTAKAIFDALKTFMPAGEEAEPTPSAPVTETASPSAPVDETPVATVAPTATVTPIVTPEPPAKKVTIKFKKKSVKIKKGKKVTLKVTLKNAKKATFSVNKKGKKIVKLSKKQAKSVVVKGKKKGKATITAKAKGKKATCKVKVK